MEINTYEQLRDLDRYSSQLHSEAIDVIAETMGVSTEAVTDISVLKKGMTNRSFRFRCKGQAYIMRIPGEGTDQLISRPNEAAVYAATEAPAKTIRRSDIGRLAVGCCADLVLLDSQLNLKAVFIDGQRIS